MTSTPGRSFLSSLQGDPLDLIPRLDHADLTPDRSYMPPLQSLYCTRSINLFRKESFGSGFFCFRFARALMSLPADRPETAGGQVELRTRGRPHSMHLPHPPTSPTEDAAKPLRRPLSHGAAGEAVGDGGGELMLLMYVLGGREVGQVTVFRRPLSVWRLDLTRL